MSVFKLLLLAEEVAAINVIVREIASVMICGITAPHDVMDGNQFQLAYEIPSYCKHPNIKVELETSMFIHYIDIYGGEFQSNGTIKIGGNYIVSLRENNPHTSCIYWKRKYPDFQAMRANCWALTKIQSFSIHFETNPFYVAEIEAHSLEQNAGESVVIYRGCFRRFNASENMKGDIMRCRSSCFSKNKFIYFALKGNMCSCGNYIDETTKRPLAKCNLTCSNAKDKCGGIGFYSVYIGFVQLPSLMGCENKNLESSEESNDMTVAQCLKLCDGTYYALLKDGRHCACSNDTVGKNIHNFTSCNKPCSGDSKNYCGGQDSWSVYATCLNKDEPSLPCSKLLACSVPWDELGVCPGVCKSGYTGEHCIEKGLGKGLQKECFPNPCEDLNSYCTYNKISGKRLCLCIKGYKKVEQTLSKETICQDVDECLANPCEQEKSTCKNLDGTYECSCHSGYTQDTPTTCKAKAKQLKGSTIIIFIAAFVVGLSLAWIAIRCVLLKKK